MTGDDDYVRRVNRVIDHVLRHLDEPLPLERLAKVAHFSPFHFHRVFRAVTGEPLHQFVRRLRLERAVLVLAREPGLPLTEVAHRCGFGSSSDFSRSFKQRYGVPPSGFDQLAARDAGRARLHHVERLPPGENPDGFEAVIRELPARTVAFLRVPDPYRGGVAPAVARLVAWAERHGHADSAWLGYQWDDPEIVDLAACRYDVGVVVDRLVPEGPIGRFDLPPLRVAQVAVCGDIDLELRAFDWLLSTWLPRSGHLPADLPLFEAWRGRPFAHGTERFELDVQLPLRS